jgi:hypothetical protein
MAAVSRVLPSHGVPGTRPGRDHRFGAADPLDFGYHRSEARTLAERRHHKPIESQHIAEMVGTAWLTADSGWRNEGLGSRARPLASELAFGKKVSAWVPRIAARAWMDLIAPSSRPFRWPRGREIAKVVRCKPNGTQSPTLCC